MNRGRSEEESPRGQPRKAPKTSSTPEGRQNAPHSYSDVVGSVRVGITNISPMTTEQMIMVNDAIRDKICEEGRRHNHAMVRGGPTFLNFSHRPGWALTICENQASKDWLAQIIPECKPWPEAQLSVLDESELPKPWTASAFISLRQAKNAADALFMISYQNEGLSAGHWRVVKETRQEDGFIAVFSLDDDSAKTLRANGCRANLGMRKLEFRVKGEHQKPNERPATTEPSAASTRTDIPGPSGLGGKPTGRTMDGSALPSRAPDGTGAGTAGRQGSAAGSGNRGKRKGGPGGPPRANPTERGNSVPQSGGGRPQPPPATGR